MATLAPKRCNSGEIRIFSANQTAGASLPAPGLYTRTYLTDTMKGVVNAGNPGQSPRDPLFTGAILRFFGVGSVSDTIDFSIWLTKPSRNLTRAVLLGTGQATLGALTGADGGAVLASENMANQITFTLASNTTSPTGPGKFLYNAYAATPQIFSPGGSDIAELILPDLCSATGLVVALDSFTCTEANGTVELVG